MTWNQPICERCWWTRNGDRVPHRLVDPPVETCAVCGLPTFVGIYFRVDPATVRFPSVTA